MLMRKQIFYLSLCFISLSGFTQNRALLLEKAYTEKSDQLYEEFLQSWNKDIQAVKTTDSLSDIEKDIYEIYIDFYNPFKLRRVGTGEWGAKLYADIEYVIVQNSIYAYTYDLDNLNYDFTTRITGRLDSLIIAKDSIMNFRPGVSFNKTPVLYLTPEYDTLINRFLGTEHYELGDGGIMNPARAKGESEKRVEFLNTKLEIIYGHWGGYWHIETHPYVFSIEFNKDRTLAKINYRLVYQGGEADYKKVNGKWVFAGARLTWIE